MICTLKCVQNADGENFGVSEAGAESLAAKLFRLRTALPTPVLLLKFLRHSQRKG